MSVDIEGRSFDSFFRAERAAIGHALALTLGDDGLGFEAVDEAMARAYAQWGAVAAMANPAGWVYRVGLNWATSFLRRRKRGAFKDFLASSSGSMVDNTADVDLHRALANLDDKHRAVVVLRFLRQWSVDEVAVALDIAPGTVKSRLNRAMTALRADANLATAVGLSERSAS